MWHIWWFGRGALLPLHVDLCLPYALGLGLSGLDLFLHKCPHLAGHLSCILAIHVLDIPQHGLGLVATTFARSLVNPPTSSVRRLRPSPAGPGDTHSLGWRSCDRCVFTRNCLPPTHSRVSLNVLRSRRPWLSPIVATTFTKDSRHQHRPPAPVMSAHLQLCFTLSSLCVSSPNCRTDTHFPHYSSNKTSPQTLRLLVSASQPGLSTRRRLVPARYLEVSGGVRGERLRCTLELCGIQPRLLCRC